MITHAVETLFLYPHITTYVLVTGDVDFRPLLQTIRRRGDASVVVCDSRNANEELLVLADEYLDHRDLEPTDSADEQESDDESETGQELPESDAYALLAETVSRMLADNKQTVLGPVKVRMKLLNPRFDENLLGFSSWKGFVLSAQKAGVVGIEPVDGDLRIILPSTVPNQGALPEQFDVLRKTMGELLKDRRTDLHLFTEINKHLKSHGFDFRKSGYRKFSELMQDAEKREIVTISRDGLDWYAQLPE